MCLAAILIGTSLETTNTSGSVLPSTTAFGNPQAELIKIAQSRMFRGLHEYITPPATALTIGVTPTHIATSSSGTPLFSRYSTAPKPYLDATTLLYASITFPPLTFNSDLNCPANDLPAASSPRALLRRTTLTFWPASCSKRL